MDTKQLRAAYEKHWSFKHSYGMESLSEQYQDKVLPNIFQHT